MFNYTKLYAIEKVALQLQHCQNNVTSHGSDWEPVLDSAQRLLDEDKTSFDALLIFTLHSFTQDGDMNEALMVLYYTVLHACIYIYVILIYLFISCMCVCCFIRNSKIWTNVCNQVTHRHSLRI